MGSWSLRSACFRKIPVLPKACCGVGTPIVRYRMGNCSVLAEHLCNSSMRVMFVCRSLDEGHWIRVTPRKSSTVLRFGPRTRFRHRRISTDIHVDLDYVRGPEDEVRDRLLEPISLHSALRTRDTHRPDGTTRGIAERCCNAPDTLDPFFVVRREPSFTDLGYLLEQLAAVGDGRRRDRRKTASIDYLVDAFIEEA